jgi:hypothetical protein
MPLKESQNDKYPYKFEKKSKKKKKKKNLKTHGGCGSPVFFFLKFFFSKFLIRVFLSFLVQRGSIAN